MNLEVEWWRGVVEVEVGEPSVEATLPLQYCS